MLFPPPEYRQWCDAPADCLVQLLFDTYGDKAARKIYLQLIHTFSELKLDALPKEIVDFHKTQEAQIEIKHPEKIALAAAYFQQQGHGMFLILIAKCLPQLYSSYKGTKVLYETGYLVGKNDGSLVARRLMETAQFFIDIMSRDSFQPGRYGFFAATKVRIIHAYVRKFMWDRGWNSTFAAEYDQPVCQEDMIGTLLAFSVCNVEGIQKIGLAISPEEIDAVVYTWHIAGKLLGVRDEFNPETMEAGQALFHHLIEKEKKLGVENKALVDAILGFMRNIFTPSFLANTPFRQQNKFPELLVSFLVGRDVAPYIGLNYHRDWYYKQLLKGMAVVLPNIFIQSRKNPLTQQLVSDNSARLVAGIFNYIKENYHLEFRIHDDILEDWKMTKYLPDYGLKTAGIA